MPAWLLPAAIAAYGAYQSGKEGGKANEREDRAVALAEKAYAERQPLRDSFISGVQQPLPQAPDLGSVFADPSNPFYQGGFVPPQIPSFTPPPGVTPQSDAPPPLTGEQNLPGHNRYIGNVGGPERRKQDEPAPYDPSTGLTTDGSNPLIGQAGTLPEQLPGSPVTPLPGTGQRMGGASGNGGVSTIGALPPIRNRGMI